MESQGGRQDKTAPGKEIAKERLEINLGQDWRRKEKVKKSPVHELWTFQRTPFSLFHGEETVGITINARDKRILTAEKIKAREFYLPDEGEMAWDGHEEEII